MRTKTDCLPDPDAAIQGLYRISKGGGHFWYLKALCELSSFRQKKEAKKKQ